MSVAEMLAAARAQGSGGPAAAKTQAEAAPVEVSAPEPPAATAAPDVQEVADEAPALVAKAVEKVDRSTMTIDQIIAWCREHDAK